MDHPSGITDLDVHLTNVHELILRVRRPPENSRGHEYVVKTFRDRSAANRALSEGQVY